MDDPTHLLEDARAILDQTLRGIPSAPPAPEPGCSQTTVINIGQLNSGPITINELTLNVGT